MAIDWSATGQMLSGLGTVGGAAAVLLAALMAKSTVDAWKRQRVAERRFEHAERTLVATYNAREALVHIRGPMIHPHELHTARQALEAEQWWEQTDEAKRERLVTAKAIINRMISTEDVFKELAICIPLAKVMFGDELEAALRALHHQRWVVRTYVDAYADGGGGAEWLAKVRVEMWQPADSEQGEISQAVRQLVATVEAKCLPALSP